MINGSGVVGAETEGGRVSAVVVGEAGRRVAHHGRAFVHAPGGFESGALAVDSWGRITEPALGLPLTATDASGLVTDDFWRSDALFRVGVRVDDAMRVVDAAGAVVHDNLHSAGGILAGASRWREKSGEGIAAASARPGRRRDPPGGTMTKKLDLTPVGDLVQGFVGRATEGVRAATGSSPAAVERFHNELARTTPRPLRQVHDLRDGLPGVRGDPAVQRPEVRGAPGRTVPARGVRRPLGGLLLELRRLHAGLPPRRPDRRAQLDGPRRDEGAGRHAGARPDHLPHHDHGGRDDAGRPDRERRPRQPRGPLRHGEGRRRPPGRPHAGRGGRDAAGLAEAASAAHPDADPRPAGVLPRLRRGLLRGGGVAPRHRGPRAPGVRGDRAEAGLLRAWRSRATGCSSRPPRRCGGW